MGSHIFCVMTDGGPDSFWEDKQKAFQRQHELEPQQTSVVQFTLNCIAISGHTAIELAG